MTTNATKRTCACGCGVFLRSTSGDDMTWACRERRVREAQTSFAPVTRPGSQRARMLAAMPGTAKQIAKATGISVRVCQAECRVLATDGRATIERTTRADGTGVVNVYRRAS